MLHTVIRLLPSFEKVFCFSSISPTHIFMFEANSGCIHMRALVSVFRVNVAKSVLIRSGLRPLALVS